MIQAIIKKREGHRGKCATPLGFGKVCPCKSDVFLHICWNRNLYPLEPDPTDLYKNI